MFKSQQWSLLGFPVSGRVLTATKYKVNRRLKKLGKRKMQSPTAAYGVMNSNSVICTEDENDV